MPAAAFTDLWFCDATERVLCTANESCHATEPQISQMEIMPVTGHLQFCIGEQCYEGVLELEREGWPEHRRVGFASVEALPLKRAYTGGIGYFAAFDEEAKRFTLSALSVASQDTTWFDCRLWEDE